mmetsp:Transcript_20138/g.27991  ORF Transcript_20138/g.27991 Transcript_20138/m.27991 type:complete len:385 (+) Transcript_20138:131-1285(+)
MSQPTFSRSRSGLDLIGGGMLKERDRVLQFVDMDGIKLLYKLKNNEHLRVSRERRKIGFVRRIKFTEETFSFNDGWQSVRLPANTFGRTILQRLSVICRVAGVAGLENWHPHALCCSQKGRVWTVQYSEGLYVRRSFTSCSDITNTLKKGDQVKEIEAKEIDGQVWVRHNKDGWSLATRKGPSPNMDNNLMTITDVPVDQIGHVKKAILRSKKSKGKLKTIAYTGDDSKSSTSVSTSASSTENGSRNVRKKSARRKKGRSQKNTMAGEEDVFGMLAKRRSENKLVGSTVTADNEVSTAECNSGDSGASSIPRTFHKSDPFDGDESLPRKNNVGKSDSLSDGTAASTLAAVASTNIFEELADDENNVDLPQFDIKQFENIKINRH